MKQNTIIIKGKEYPCRMTMGAMLEFYNRTGKEATMISGTDLSAVVVLLFCCLASSCRADQVELPYKNEMDMADHLAPEDLASWQSGNFQVETIDGDIEMSVEKKKE